AVLVNDSTKKAIAELEALAPLHNGPALRGIEACEAILPGTPQVTVFDTAFHQSIPDYAYTYSLPYELCKKYLIRRYGAHGTSHHYVALRAAELVGKPLNELKVITCHLGNGSSITAIKNGKSWDTSMGFTPLAGLTMGTRCGDIDPAIVTFLMEKEGLTPGEMDELMNRRSGVLGVSGLSSDFRDIEAAMDEGNERARLAWDIFVHTAKKYIGAYTAVLNGLDVLVFTAGLGENSPRAREAICRDMDYLGIKIDAAKNQVRGQEREITAPGAKVRTFVIPTNEELMIARETLALL
ncbi:MAG: acetate kinase, partial [Moorella sp. (in: firmicutes)]